MSIHVQLERFEGPLGLLLHLIREQEMDVFNINIHQITRQYLEYIKTMRRLDLEVAGDFVAMASTLLHIKSRMLLPQYNEEGEEIQEDPRKELVQKLMEYKKFRELSADLYKRPLLGRDVFTRGDREEVEAAEEGELVLEENPLFSLIAAYRTSIKNMKKTVHSVVSSLQSIAERILEIRHVLNSGRRVIFRELISDTSAKSNQVLVTFLSLLELAKMGLVSVFQSEAFADIHIEAKMTIEREVVTKVESYDSVHAAQKADEIMSEAQQLSLSEPEAMLEGEVAPVVQESYAEAASDDDIAAEEARLMAADLGVPVEEMPVLDHISEALHLTDETPAPGAPEAPVTPEEVSITFQDFVAPEQKVHVLDEVTVPPVEMAHVEVPAEIEMAPQEVSAAVEESAMDEQSAIIDEPLNIDPSLAQDTPMELSLAENLPMEAAPTDATEEVPGQVAMSDVPATDIPTTDVVASPEMEAASMPEATQAATNERNLNSALSAAFAAFDAFNEDEPKSEPTKSPDRPPEVES